MTQHQKIEKIYITGWFGCNWSFDDLHIEKIKFNDFEPPQKNKKKTKIKQDQQD
jgi:hypothetical protein